MEHENKSLLGNFRETKLRQRCHNVDITGMLLFTLFLMTQGHNSGIDRELTRRFIRNCFLCGCNKDHAGKNVSAYVFRIASFVDLYLRIKKEYPKKKDFEIEHMVVMVFKSMFSNLKECLNEEEKVLIYGDHEKNDIVVPLKFDSDDPTKKCCNIFKSKSFRTEKKYRTSKNIIQQDNLSLLYRNLNAYFINDQILIYYGVYDNTAPPIHDKSISTKYRFCMRSNRSKDGCATKSFAKDLRNELSEKSIEDTQFGEFFVYATLPARRNLR